MTNSRHQPAVSRPSLMGSEPSTAVTAGERTRVLEELGGKQRTTTGLWSRKGTVASLVVGLLAATSAGIYWAGGSQRDALSSPSSPTPAAGATQSVQTLALASNAAVPTPSSPTVAPPAAEPSPARIVEETPAAPSIPPKTAKADNNPDVVAQSRGSATASTIKSREKQNSTRNAVVPAAPKSSRKEVRTATKSNEANRAATVPTKTKPSDPDTDLLAALLRRSRGNQRSTAVAQSSK